MVRGLAWTVLPVLRQALRPGPWPSESTPWSTTIDDPAAGPVRLTGRLHPGSGDRLVVLVHGLGGAVDSPYMLAASQALARLGLPHLRLHLRGADRSGDDYYHAGLIEDLEAALASPEARAFGRVTLWGFSLGGHVALRLAALRPPPALAQVVAVCPPLDLDAGAHAIDRWRRRPFLRYVLDGLVEIYERVAARKPVPVPLERARAIRSIRTWDDEIIAPRFGFRDAADYYAQVSAGPTLGQIPVETLLLASASDPMIPLGTVLPSLRRASPRVDARVVEGGHVGFSASLDLGQRGPRGLSDQVAAWIASRS